MTKCQKCYKYSWILYKYTYYDFREKTMLLCPRCTKTAMTYGYEIEVSIRGPSRYMSGVYRAPWDENKIAKEIKESICRHVDNIGNVYITTKKYTPEEFWYKDVRISKKKRKTKNA